MTEILGSLDAHISKTSVPGGCGWMGQLDKGLTSALIEVEIELIPILAI